MIKQAAKKKPPKKLEVAMQQAKQRLENLAAPRPPPAAPQASANTAPEISAPPEVSAQVVIYVSNILM